VSGHGGRGPPSKDDLPRRDAAGRAAIAISLRIDKSQSDGLAANRISPDHAQRLRPCLIERSDNRPTAWEDAVVGVVKWVFQAPLISSSGAISDQPAARRARVAPQPVADEG